MTRFVPVAREEEIAPGTALQVVVDDVPIAVCRLADGFYAISDVCTHDRYYLSYGRIDGDEIECPMHAAVFNIKTGEVEIPPAEKPVATYPCRVRDGVVEVGMG
jgi:3-phenylpropionate/trans-cinnamate dioxygenase ferredoxin subunit